MEVFQAPSIEFLGQYWPLGQPAASVIAKKAAGLIPSKTTLGSAALVGT